MNNLFRGRLEELIALTETNKRQFALHIGITPTMVTKWIKHNAQPTAEVIYLTAKYFNVSADYLLGLTEDDTPHWDSQK